MGSKYSKNNNLILKKTSLLIRRGAECVRGRGRWLCRCGVGVRVNLYVTASSSMDIPYFNLHAYV